MKIIESLIIIITFLQYINSQTFFFYLSNITQQVINNCKSKGETGVRQFSDCDLESNYTNNQICCYVTGINVDGTDYRGCVAMDLKIFGNKTLSYESHKLSATLICDKNYNFGKYYKNIFNFLIYIGLFLIL